MDILQGSQSYIIKTAKVNECFYKLIISLINEQLVHPFIIKFEVVVLGKLMFPPTSQYEYS